MDRFFKVDRAREEIRRLNLEIPRVITHIFDEEEFLLEKEAEFQESNVGLAHQITLYRMERGRSNILHMRRFRKLAKLKGFTGTIERGISVDGIMPGADMRKEDDGAMVVDAGGGEAVDAASARLEDEEVALDEEEEDFEQAEQDLSTLMFNVLRISSD
jgi:hypothetical protein